MNLAHWLTKLWSMKIEDHCRQSVEMFGAPREPLHRWMDEFAGSEKYGMRHRRVRHHAAGIREAARLFGPEAESVARQHVIADLKEEGWAESDPFPRDERHYVALGLF